LKRIFFYLLILASCAAIAFMFWNGPEKQMDKKGLLNYLPQDAYMVLEVPSAEKFDHRLNAGILIWEELQAVPYFQGSDSLLRHLSNVIGAAGFVLSWHPAGAERSDCLLTLDPLSEEASSAFMKLVGAEQTGDSQYNDETFLTFKKEEATYFLRKTDEVMQVSPSKLILERCSRLDGHDLTSLQSFKTINKSKSSSSLAYLYIDHEKAKDWQAEFFQSDHIEQEPMGVWSLSDLSIRTNALQAIGLIQVSDSADHMLSDFAPYQAISMESYLEFIPDHTVEFIFRGQSSPDLSDGSALEHVKGEGDLEAWIDCANENCDAAKYYIYPLEDGGIAIEDLKNVKEMSSSFKGLEIYLVDAGILDAARMEQWGLKGMLNVCVMKEMLLISSDSETLKGVIERVLIGKTFEKDEQYESLLEDLSSSSAYYHYMDIKKAKGRWEQRLNPAPYQSLFANSEAVQKYQALVVQYESAGDGLFYRNVLLKYNPEGKKETNSVWETSVDTTMTWGPALVKNHYTQLLEVLVQDASHQLYLISNTGKILWKRALPGPILSEVSQVDVLKNGKLQMIFNTKNSIHLLDRNGEDVSGFPITLKSPASGQVSVMDYENNRKYRILIGTENGDLLNFDNQGKPVQGWAFNKLKDDKVVGAQEHFTIGNKDYISCITQKGKVTFLERNGKLRHAAKSELKDFNGKEYSILKGKSITDSRILYASVHGEFKELNVGGGDRVLQADLAQTQKWSNEKWLGRGEEDVYVMSDQLEERHKCLDGDSAGVQGLKQHILLWYPLTGAANLMDEHFKVLPGFPIMGSGPAVIDDVNGDGSKDLILRGGSRSLSMYSLQ